MVMGRRWGNGGETVGRRTGAVGVASRNPGGVDLKHNFPVIQDVHLREEGSCKATWKKKFKLPWREAGPPDHHDDKVDSDQ